MSMSHRIVKFRRFLCGCILTGTFFGTSGCQRNAAVGDGAKAPKLRSFEELSSVVDSTLRDAREALSQFQTSGGGARAAMLRQSLATGLAACDEIQQLTPTSETTAKATLGRLELLDVGAAFGDPNHAQEFEKQLEVSLKNPAAVATYRKARLIQFRRKYVDHQQDDRESLQAVETLVSESPKNSEVHQLVLTFALHCVARSDFETASACVEVADKMDVDDSQVKLVRDTLTTQQRTHSKNVALRNENAASIKQFASQHLRGMMRGNFIFFCRKSDGFGSPCYYFVVQSAADAVTLARQTEQRGWKWRIEAILPATAEGATKAAAMREKLEKDNTISTPAF